MKFDFKKVLPHLAAVALFLLVVLVFFQPVTEGYQLQQGDNMNFIGTSKEIRDYREKFQQEPLWTNTVFGGMPAGLISVQFYNNWMGHVQSALSLWLPAPANYLFLCMIGFYIMLLCFGVNPWLAMAGGLAYGLSTFHIHSIEAGHNSKMLAMAFMAPVLGGMVLTYRGKMLLGAAVTMLFFALELRANHIQVTYYLVMMLVMVGLGEMSRYVVNQRRFLAVVGTTLFYIVVDLNFKFTGMASYLFILLGLYILVELALALFKGNAMQFIIRTGLVVLAFGLAVLPNYSNINSLLETAPETTRSESKLTIKADGTSNKDEKTSGLDRDYITDWSYGKLESINLLIPNATGGASGALGNNEGITDNIEDPNIAKQVAESNAYWGEQAIAAPYYMGAVVITLFLLAFFFVKDASKWALLAITLLALMLAWGRHFPGLTDYFIDKVPGYNKFRAVTIIMVILQVTLPLLAIWGLSQLDKHREEFSRRIKSFYIVAGSILGVILLVILLGNASFSYLSDREQGMFADAALKSASNVQQMQYINEYKSSLTSVRASLFNMDAFRTLVFVLATMVMVFLFIRGTISNYLMYVFTALLILIDMWSVDVRFLSIEASPNGEGYVGWFRPEDKLMPFTSEPADNAILKFEAAKQPALVQSITAYEQQLQKKKVDEGAENTAVTLQESDAIRFRELNFATNYKVLDMRNPFFNGRTSYFHKSIGGYHGAKQKRIQEIIEFHYVNEIGAINAGLQTSDINKIRDVFKSTNVLNMMNTRYIIFNPNGEGSIEVSADTVIPPRAQPGIIINDMAYGNAWTPANIKLVKNDDEEILALDKTDLKNTVVLQEAMLQKLGINKTAGTGNIVMTSYLPNKIEYDATGEGENIAVFSEIYSDKGWTAEVDGKQVPIARVNYLLRAIALPAGRHKVVFKYDLPSYHTSEKISLAGSIIVLGLFLLAVINALRPKKNNTPETSKPGVID